MRIVNNEQPRIHGKIQLNIRLNNQNNYSQAQRENSVCQEQHAQNQSLSQIHERIIRQNKSNNNIQNDIKKKVDAGDKKEKIGLKNNKNSGMDLE